jgi:hypothetical protein
MSLEVAFDTLGDLKILRSLNILRNHVQSHTFLAFD